MNEKRNPQYVKSRKSGQSTEVNIIINENKIKPQILEGIRKVGEYYGQYIIGEYCLVK